MMKFVSVLFAAMFTAFVVYAAEPYSPAKWEDDIRAFEEKDKVEPIPPNPILFIGSSSIRMWDLEKWFPYRATLNRGFGGSHIEDSVFYFDRIVTPYRPRAIVFYAGDNDINYGKSPGRVVADFKEFVALMKQRLPEAKLFYIAIKPSLKRWNLVGEMREANRRIEQICMKHENLVFVDIDAPMIAPDGKPDESLFADDGLHLNEKGYQLWTSVLQPKLDIIFN